MATGVQVVFDCADPDGLARFWAEALGYKLQDPPPALRAGRPGRASRASPRSAGTTPARSSIPTAAARACTSSGSRRPRP
jgi:hypothetical protein